MEGNVLVKCLPREGLLAALRRKKGCLQTAGLLCPEEDRPALSDLLARAGVTRITRAGGMSAAFFLARAGVEVLALECCVEPGLLAVKGEIPVCLRG